MTLFDPVTQVRLQLGEEIPPGGVDTDTMFTDAQIQSFLDTNNQYINKATAMAWRAKAAAFVVQVDVQEGNSSRKLSQAYEAAMSQARFWADQPENNMVIGATRQGVNRRIMPW